MIAAKEEGHIENEFQMTFTCVPLHEHCGIALRQKWPRLVATFITSFGAFWLLGVEAPGQLMGLELKLPRPTVFVVFALLSLAVGLIVVIYGYVNSVLPGFEGERGAFQRIAHLRRPRWEATLALALMQDRLSGIDRELQALKEGMQYVPIRSRPNIADYFAWLGMRPENLRRMVQVASRVLVWSLPCALKSASPNEILDWVESTRQIYKSTLEFEIEGYSTKPPDGCERIHDIQRGWTKPIQEGIHQVLDFLRLLASADLKSLEQLRFLVEVREPDGIDEFCAGLLKIAP